MKKLGKILPSVSLILFITTLILVVLTSHAFAKYYKTFDLESFSARPAMFEFVPTTSGDAIIFVDFGEDSDTSPVYGTRTATRMYGFSVKMAQSEVAALLKVELSLPSNLYAKVAQADKTQPGVWVNLKIYVVKDYGLETENMVQLTENNTLTAQSDGTGLWTYTEVVPAGSNPHGQQDCTNYRLCFEVINVEDTSTVKDAAIYTTKVGLNVSAIQID